jgi:hypothetical protein
MINHIILTVSDVGVAVDGYVIGWIGDHQIRLGSVQQPRVVRVNQVDNHSKRWYTKAIRRPAW